MIRRLFAAVVGVGVIIGIGALTWLGAAAPVARAHDIVLTGSNPTEGAVVTTMTSLRLEFSTGLKQQSSTFTLRRADRSEIALPAPTYAADHATLSWTIPALAPGRYRLGFDVTLDDGDPGRGAVEFEVSADGVSHAPPWPADDPRPQLHRPEAADASGSFGWLIAGAAVLVVGFVAVVWYVRVRRDSTSPRPGDPADL